MESSELEQLIAKARPYRVALDAYTQAFETACQNLPSADVDRFTAENDGILGRGSSEEVITALNTATTKLNAAIQARIGSI